jgi:hypothetical protein
LAVHPNSLANLKPPLPGEVRNPLGRKTCGASIKEHINLMGDLSEAEIQAVSDDEAAPIAKRIAANRMLSALAVADDFDRICDRTDGKPSTNNNHHHTGDIIVKRIIRGDEILPPAE